jgi:hypothetical protein
MTEKISLGDKVQLKDEVKQELISNFNLSKGLSGVCPEHVNNEFTVDYFDGSNIGVLTNDGVPYSFNHSRFKLNTNEACGYCEVYKNNYNQNKQEYKTN